MRPAGSHGPHRCSYAQAAPEPAEIVIDDIILKPGCGMQPASNGAQQEVHEHEALRGGSGRRLYCWLISFSRIGSFSNALIQQSHLWGIKYLAFLVAPVRISSPSSVIFFNRRYACGGLIRSKLITSLRVTNPFCLASFETSPRWRT